MASKIKCPACGAKNAAATHRCRICTAVINPEAAKPAAVEEPVTPLGIDHFDPGDIDRQVRPARERFASTGGALAARIAAAQGTSDGGPDLVDADLDLGPVATPTATPIAFDDEPFDPDALFREMG